MPELEITMTVTPQHQTDNAPISLRETAAR